MCCFLIFFFSHSIPIYKCLLFVCLSSISCLLLILCFIIVFITWFFFHLLVCSNCWHFCWKWSTVVCCNWTYTLWFISLPHSSYIFFLLFDAKSVCSNDIIIVRHHHYGISFCSFFSFWNLVCHSHFLPFIHFLLLFILCVCVHFVLFLWL